MMRAFKKLPQITLLVVFGFSLLFAGQAANAASGQTDASWNLIKKSDGQVVCIIDVTHTGEPTFEEIKQACGNAPASGWKKGEYSLSKIAPTPTPSGQIQSWLDTPDQAAKLQTNRPLAYLAGKLIAAGYVDVSSCNGTSLLTNGYASSCGLSLARPYIFVWQNRFDASILRAAQNEDVPAYMLKNLLIQESQLWPQESKHTLPEYGMGQLSEYGADTLLMWNNGFFTKICKEALDKEKCKKDYLSIPASDRAYLRGTSLIRVRADCANCPLKLDLATAEQSISVFAAALKANFNQVDQISMNLTGKPAMRQMEIQEVWKLAAANYNAGSGCTSSAMRTTLKANNPLRWKYISKSFESGCGNVSDYIENISMVDAGAPLPPADQINYAIRVLYGLPLPTPSLIPLTPTPEPGIVPPATPALKFTATPTAGATATPKTDPTVTVTATPVVDATSTPTIDPALTVNATPVASATSTPTIDPALTVSATPVVGETSTPTIDPALTVSATPVVGATSTPTIDPTLTVSATPVVDATSTTINPAVTNTAIPSATFTPEIIPTATDDNVNKQLQNPHVKNEVVIKIDPKNRNEAIKILKKFGINLGQNSAAITSLEPLVVNIDPAQLPVILNALQNNNGFEYVEPNYLAQISSLPNDPFVAQQQNLWVMQLPQTWDALPSMQEVLVAVIDSGIDFNHPDLSNAIWQNAGETGQDASGADKRFNGIDDDSNGYVDDWRGWNMVSGANNPDDDHGHGTHLSGVIGAQMNNNIGIAGVAPNARILPVKVLDNTGNGSYAQVAEGIIYAADMGARVINLGLGGTGSSQMLQDAVDYAVARGALVVAAGGNSGTNIPNYPAAYPGVIAVSAVDNNLSWAPFSSSGDHISLAAPGIDIYSTIPGGGYGTFSGTSLSSAEVSGVAALLAGQPQFSDVNTLRSALLGSAYDLGAPGRDPFFGYGVVHAFDALAYGGPILPTPTPWTVPTSTGTPGSITPMSFEDLWATAQTYSFSITNPANSIDSAFNDLLASITGLFGSTAANNWTFTAINDTSLTAVAQVNLDLRFYMSGWVNDTYYIQVFDNTNPACISGWCTVYTLKFLPTNPMEGQPPSTLTTLSIPATSVLNTAARVNAAQVRITGSGVTGGGADNVTIYIDEARLHVLDVLPPTATPTSTPEYIATATLPASRWMTATPIAGEPHNHYLATADECAACHRSHTAKGFELRSDTGEENVCFACHKSGGPGTDVQLAFKANTLTRFFSHGVSTTTNIHISNENVGASFGVGNRHIECEDCHAPHSTARTDPSGSVSAPSIQQEMYDSSGVNPIWTVAGAPSGYTFMTTALREYQLCFKCHSSYTTLPTYKPDGYQPVTGYIANGLNKLNNNTGAQIADSKDLAKEFNSYQVSFHPVAALGRNRSVPVGSFVAGWSQDSMVYCSDCHQNAIAPTNGNGPHGSPLLHLLDGSAEYITKTDPAISCAPGGCPNIHNTGEVCFKCHKYGTYATGVNPPETTNFRNGVENLHAFHSFGACYTCHDTHGSEQDRLINFDTSVVTVNTGATSQNAWQFDYATNTGTCSLACHDGDHDSAKSYTR